MTHQTTPQIDAFRSIVKQAGTLHAELSTLATAIRERDAIRASMGDCRNEAEARKLLGDLTRAEETVIVKQAREPRLQAELAAHLAETEDAFHAANTEITRLVEDTPKQATEAFRDLLTASQLDHDSRNIEQANAVVTKAIRTRALAGQQEDRLHEAWRAVASSTDPLAKRVEGFKTSLVWFDKVLVAQAQIADEDKRMAAACDAFRKVLTNR